MQAQHIAPIAMQDALKRSFPAFSDGSALIAAIESICSEFGRVTYLEILREYTDSGTHCACFLRLASRKAENAFLRKYRAERFAGDIYFNAHIAKT
jgi:hypothetical protein